MTPRKTFLDLAERMVQRLSRVTPGARADPFFAKRLYTHFLNGVDSPHLHERHVAAVEARLEGERALRATPVAPRKPRAPRRSKAIPPQTLGHLTMTLATKEKQVVSCRLAAKLSSLLPLVVDEEDDPVSIEQVMYAALGAVMFFGVDRGVPLATLTEAHDLNWPPIVALFTRVTSTPGGIDAYRGEEN